MTDKTYENVKIEREGKITFLIMNRPEKRNAMSPQLHFDMEDAMDHIAVDDQTEVMVITGAGPAFCAGQDLRLYFRGTENDPILSHRAHEASDNWRWLKLDRFPKLTIAMVNGYCFGGGLTQMAACDLAIAADEALFGASEVNWGIIPGGNVSWVMTQIMSYRNAMHYAITGDTFDGKRAVEIGAVNYSVPLSKLREETIKLAHRMMQKNPMAVRYTKEAIRTVRTMSEVDARDYLAAKSAQLILRDKEGGRKQGMNQFLDEKSFRPGLGAYQRRSNPKD
jgi:trans-feruloyl-CoA hydratase/vanillin synthase